MAVKETKESPLPKLIEKAEEHLAAVQEQLLAGGLDAAGEAAALNAVDAALARIERLQAAEARLAGLKSTAPVSATSSRQQQGQQDT